MNGTQHRVRVGILGASGYAGAELIRLLARHPNAEIVLLTGKRRVGEKIDDVFPHLAGLGLPRLAELSPESLAEARLDAVFCALPHGVMQGVAATLFAAPDGNGGGPKIIDLSPDFRLTGLEVYAKAYGRAHGAPYLQREAVYGLTELARDEIRGARLIANPGCYPTVALLSLVPLVSAGQIDPHDIIIDAKSGVSGAGRGLKERMLAAEVAEGVSAYGIASHRHSPEIDQALSGAAGAAVTANFTPHLMPMNRGILATIYVRLAGAASADDLRETLSRQYEGEAFVGVVAESVSPATRHVRGSNRCLIGVFADRVKGRAIIVAVLDNLVKGASGQAIQNMNLACQLPEGLGLDQLALFP